MNEINCWLTKLKNEVAHKEWDTTISAQILNHAPRLMFGSIISESQHEAIAHWLELCQQLSLYYQRSGEDDLAFHYMQFSYSKVQLLAIAPDQDEAIQRWAIKKLERMTINMLEFCQRHPQPIWQEHSRQLIEDHISFMHLCSDKNLSYGSVIQQRH